MTDKIPVTVLTGYLGADKDMQEVGVIALMDENDARGELLQQRCVEQAREAFLGHFGK
jgi:hypothetical protein